MFNSHAKSDCHEEAVQADQLPKNTDDVAEELNAAQSVEKANNREMFLRILQNIRFLAQQGPALSGGTEGEDSNFTQLSYVYERSTAPRLQIGWKRNKISTHLETSETKCCRLSLLAYSVK